MSAPRIYPNLFDAVADGLEEIFKKGYYADKVVSHLLKRDKRWGARDRAFIAETVYECVRWWRLLAFFAEDESAESVISAYWAWKFKEGLELLGFPFIHPGEVERKLSGLEEKPAILESFPDWMNQEAKSQLKEKWPSVRTALNETAQVFLRTNTLKTTRNDLLQSLQHEGIEVEADSRGDLTIKVLNRRNLWATKSFKRGEFEIQDIGSQQIVPPLEVEPGMTVIDACAGAGGKTLQLAAEMKNKGRIIALDVSTRKLQELKKRARRAGVSNIEVREITGTKTIKRLKEKADRVLLDVPCSGLGVLRRNPDAKWKLRPAFLAEVHDWQKDILQRYQVLAKPQGKIVYATCSILPSESEEQIKSFLASNSDWNLTYEKRYSPVDGFDGFYISRLER